MISISILTFTVPEEAMNRIGRRTAVCMIALVLVAIVVSLFRP